VTVTNPPTSLSASVEFAAPKAANLKGAAVVAPAVVLLEVLKGSV
jgi:hypothetical protein